MPFKFLLKSRQIDTTSAEAMKALVDFFYPVGSTHIQLPITSTGTKSTDFPTTQYPATKFGGTWTQVYDTEGIFFKTEGDPLSQTDGENNNRTSGLQTDMMQGHYHNINFNYVFLATGGTYGARSGGQYEITPYILEPITDGTNGTPRTGKETRGRNRLIKIWKRTA